MRIVAGLAPAPFQRTVDISPFWGLLFRMALAAELLWLNQEQVGVLGPVLGVTFLAHQSFDRPMYRKPRCNVVAMAAETVRARRR